MDALNSVGPGNLQIIYNFQLADCCALYNLINGGGVTGAIIIFFNKVGCNSTAEILTNCAPPPLVGQPNSFGTANMESSLEEREVAIFPNPAKDRVTVRTQAGFNNGTLRVVDLTGRTVHTRQLMSDDNQPVINLDNWHAGVYFVQLQIDGETFTRKLIVN